MALKPFEWKDKPALIEHLFPVQKISAESFKEQSAVQSKTLTALGSYWKGRKPLILNKACILGSLLPATDDRLKDLEIFELLMGMDSESMQKRLEEKLPVSKRDAVGELLVLPYNEQVKKAKRPEEIGDCLFTHVWSKVNKHLGTSASSFPELVEQIGIARFGRRPKVADVFSGSGQIPFEAARLGCDVYASDLNPIACMLTWGGFNIVGAGDDTRNEIDTSQKQLANIVRKEIDKLGIDKNDEGWSAKAYLYCNQVVCPESGWKVPLLPTRIISQDYKAVAELTPLPDKKEYKIDVVFVDSKEDLEKAKMGTVQGGDLVHNPNGNESYRVSIKTIRGDYKEGKGNKNKLRPWSRHDFAPAKSDIFQERLYCIQWQKKIDGKLVTEIRSVTDEDIAREQKVIDYVREHLEEWQEMGYVPDMVIEKGYNTDQPIRERGWTHWHHLFNPRQLLVNGLIRRFSNAYLLPNFAQLLNYNSRLCVWNSAKGQGAGNISNVFYNQALNTLFNYGCRSAELALKKMSDPIKSVPINNDIFFKSKTHPAQELAVENDVYVTDPPYGDAVKYEEITEFFIAWLRKNPPEEFAHWTWDSRRSIAIKGEDEGFRQGMVAAYRRMTEMMPDNGIQVLMFAHQSGAIWADMANIIWASGLQVTAAWYVVTETDSAIRKGANIKGTIILVLRKRHKELETFRDDLGWEIEEAVKEQVESLGLDKQVRPQGAEGLYTDADLKMAGYAAALKVLTTYSHIDGKDMVTEAEAPRQKGKKTLVDEMIEFAVQTALQFLVPAGFEKGEWQKLQAEKGLVGDIDIERYD
jgi:putative DNA methylase